MKVSSFSGFLLAALVSCVSAWTEIIFDDFDGGWGNWNGGYDAAWRSDEGFFEGTHSLRIRDNSGSGSSITTNSLALASYSQVRITFWFKARSMEQREDFFLDYFDGATWKLGLAQWVRGRDFGNMVASSDTQVVLDEVLDGIILTDQAEIRFRNDASGNNDHVYIDNVLIEAQ